MVSKHVDKRMELPWEEDVSATAFSLLILPLTYRFHPIDLIDGKLGESDASNVKLTFDDVILIVNVSLNSTHSVFESGVFGEPYQSNYVEETKHYAIAIEWVEAAEMLVVLFLVLGRPNVLWGDQLLF